MQTTCIQAQHAPECRVWLVSRFQRARKHTETKCVKQKTPTRKIKKRIPVSCCKMPKDSRHARVSACLRSVCIFQKPNLEWWCEMTARARGQHVGGRESWTGADWSRLMETGWKRIITDLEASGQNKDGVRDFIFKSGRREGVTTSVTILEKIEGKNGKRWQIASCDVTRGCWRLCQKSANTRRWQVLALH